MSHSLVIGQDVPEAANGVDSPGSPEISDRPVLHTLKCDGRMTQDGGLEENQTEGETHTDTHHITNNSSPHPDSSCTDTLQTHSTSMPTADTQMHSQTLDKDADYPPKPSSEDLNDSVFLPTSDTRVANTTETKDGHHTDAQQADGQPHDNSTHIHSGVPVEDEGRGEELRDRTEGEDGQQQEEEEEEEEEEKEEEASQPTEVTLSSASCQEADPVPHPGTSASCADTAPRPASVAPSSHVPVGGDSDGEVTDNVPRHTTETETETDDGPQPAPVAAETVLIDDVPQPTPVMAETGADYVPRPTPAAAETGPPVDGAQPTPEDVPRHVMAEVRVRGMPERERVVRGMQDSKSLDELSGACGGGPRKGSRAGQAEGGRRATISSALELEGTVSHEGDLTNFIAKNLEEKIKMSSRPSLDCDSDSGCSGPVVRPRGSSRRPADIPPIDPSVLLDLQRHTQDVAQSVELMMRSLSGTIQNMTALSVGYIQTYRDSVDSLGESVDMSIKGMYTLMARCEELDRSMKPIHVLAAQIRDIKRTLDALEAICK